MHNVKPYILTAGTVTNNLKGIIEMIIARINAFSFMGSVKGIPATGNSIYM